MFSYPYLYNNGFKLYTDFIYPYPPLLTLTLAGVFKVFGYKVVAIKVFTWFILLITDVLIYLVVEKLTKSKLSGILALLFFVITSPFLEGNMLWFDIAVLPFVLAGFYFLLEGKSRQFQLSGLLLGLSALIKQNFAVFIIFVGLFLILKDRSKKRLVDFIVSPMLLAFVFLLFLLLSGSFEEFLNWSLVYPSNIWTRFPGYVGMNIEKKKLLDLLLLSLPVLVVFTLKGLKKIKAKKNLVLLLLFLAGSLVTVYPRFSYFHLQVAIAFMAVGFGYAVYKLKVDIKVIAIYLLLIGIIIVRPQARINWQKEDRFVGYGDQKLAEVINNNSSQEEPIYLLGLHSGLYSAANRLPAKPWLDNFGWYFEVPGIQEEVIKRWEDNMPYAVFEEKRKSGNWYDLGTYKPEKLVKWLDSNYNNMGEIYSGVILWQRR